MVAVTGDALVAFLGRGFQADHDRFLPDIQVAEPGDQTHPVKLPRLLLEAPDQQHVAVIANQFRLLRLRNGLA